VALIVKDLCTESGGRIRSARPWRGGVEPAAIAEYGSGLFPKVLTVALEALLSCARAPVAALGRTGGEFSASAFDLLAH
jgi:hypothetical protein